MITAKIDDRGHWLIAPAAASYARMLAAGMPTGGVASAGRTHAEQTALWDAYKAGTGNLAAYPGTSLHESGLALDLTRGTPAQLWAAHDGDPYHVASGEHIRANDYGWRRTVPSEAWHFSYDAAKDKHIPAPTAPAIAYPTLRMGSIGKWVRALQLKLGGRADGVYGPLTRGRVKAAQKRLGLTVDGIAGPKTLAKLGVTA